MVRWTLPISIHALLAESDVEEVEKLSRVTVISIHALLAESDELEVLYTDGPTIFLSTLSLRRATRKSFRGRRCSANFYPRSPCGERRFGHVTVGHQKQFLSTLSLRRAT